MLYNEFLNKAKTIHGDKYIYDDETEKCFNGSHSVIQYWNRMSRKTTYWIRWME